MFYPPSRRLYIPMLLVCIGINADGHYVDFFILAITTLAEALNISIPVEIFLKYTITCRRRSLEPSIRPWLLTFARPWLLTVSFLQLSPLMLSSRSRFCIDHTIYYTVFLFCDWHYGIR